MAVRADINKCFSESGVNMNDFAQKIQQQALLLGFEGCGICALETPEDVDFVKHWLARGWHGKMDWMVHHLELRADLTRIMPQAKRAILVRMAYPVDTRSSELLLNAPTHGYISRYALGRDYHKVLRGRLQKLGIWMSEQLQPLGFRVCVDSAPVLEKALAREAGLGWIGKHTLLLHREAGSYFFLGVLLTDAELPIEKTIGAYMTVRGERSAAKTNHAPVSGAAAGVLPYAPTKGSATPCHI